VDEGIISGFLNMFDWTFLDPSYPDVLKQCRSYIMGPVIEIRANYELLDKFFGSVAENNSNDENKGISLKKAGITEDRYALIVNSLLMVRRDSENPEGIEVPSLDFTPTTQEEKELAKVVETMRHDALARKDNVKLYNKFKTELDPILDILEKHMGGE
jgi:vacuolar-type H+-ATPase subunit D/Vma8